MLAPVVSRARRAPVMLVATLVLLIAARTEAMPSSSDALITHQSQKGKIEVRYGRKTHTFAPGQQIELPARNGDQVRLIVADQNTLLFAYTLGARKEEKTPDFEAMKKLGETLGEVFPKHSPTPPAESRRMLAIEGLAADTPLELVQASFSGATIKVSETKQAATRLTKSGKQIYDWVQQSTKAELTDAVVKPDVLDADISSVTEALAFLRAIGRASEDEQVNVTTKVRDGTVDGPLHRTALRAGAFFETFPDLERIFAVRAEIDQDLRALRQFVSDYRGYRAALKARTPIGVVEANNELRRFQDVVIGENARYAGDPVVAAHIAEHTGTYTFVVTPLQLLHYRIGAGVIYSFVRNPEYSVATSATGTLTVAEKSSDYNKVGGAVTLNVFPDRLFEEGVKWFGQIGASPAKDANALLLGAGFEAYGKFNLAAGIIYQQRRELGGGQKVGATLTKAEDLNVRHRFATGFYVQLGVAY